MKRSIASFLFFVTFLPLSLYGQAVSARLEGLVQDPAKAVVGSAAISAVQQETGEVFKYDQQRRWSLRISQSHPGPLQADSNRLRIRAQHSQRDRLADWRRKARRCPP